MIVLVPVSSSQLRVYAQSEEEILNSNDIVIVGATTTTNDNLIEEIPIFVESNSLVSVYVVGTYCEQGLGFGKVSFKSNKYNDFVFQVLGEDKTGKSIIYTFREGEYEIPAGIYSWSSILTSNDINSESFFSGKFVIDIKCENSKNPEDAEKNAEVNLVENIIEEDLLVNSNIAVPKEELVVLKSQRENVDDVKSVHNTEEGEVSVASSTSKKVEQTTNQDSKKTVVENKKVEIPVRNKLKGEYTLFLETKEANSVEWYIKHDSGDSYEYLGKASFNNESLKWEYFWDTTRVPDGNYVLAPEISSNTGREYKDTPSFVTVKNEDKKDFVSNLEGSLTSRIKEALPQVSVANDASKAKEMRAKKNIIEATIQYDNGIKNSLNNNQNLILKKVQEELRGRLGRSIDVESNKMLNETLDNNEENKNKIKEKIIAEANSSLELINKTAQGFGVEISEEEMEGIRKEISMEVDNLENVMEGKKSALQGNVKQEVFEDSDKDGVSNYDEVNIYDTNPLDVDTDGDGYTDGAEIVGGFNPKNSSIEAVVKHEDPRSSGFVEEDNLSIEKVSVKETGVDKDGNEKATKILFAGTAPANSFVTFYVYSKPIIVTVKTDENGNWNYLLDKELEDGEHEIHVAFTDNSGKIFSKSKPLFFVKAAAAVTVGEKDSFNNNVTRPSFFDGKYLYVVALLIIAIIGGTLVFIGSKPVREE